MLTVGQKGCHPGMFGKGNSKRQNSLENPYPEKVGEKKRTRAGKCATCNRKAPKKKPGRAWYCPKEKEGVRKTTVN